MKNKDRWNEKNPAEDVHNTNTILLFVQAKFVLQNSTLHSDRNTAGIQVSTVTNKDHPIPIRMKR